MEDNRSMNILIVGVGGQGTLLAARVLGKFAEISRSDCKLNEVHGMAQRGGSVVTHVKISDKVFSPVIEEGEADIILAFEELEGLRYGHYLKKDGLIIVNKQQIMPMPVILGAEKYPVDPEKELRKYNVMFIDGVTGAKMAGSARAVNIVIIGVLTKYAGFDKTNMEKAVELSVKPQFIELNKKALSIGYEM